VANPAAEDDFVGTLNEQSLVVKQGFVEPSLQAATAAQAYQFERIGYFVADSKDSSAQQLVFNQTVGLRDTWTGSSDAE
jgi:glutaminyl-tRNA synthetase